MTLPNSDLFIINRNGVNYQVDFNSLKKYIPGIPAGSRCLFFMDSAPYGWTIDRNSKFTEASVRVVSGKAVIASRAAECAPCGAKQPKRK